MVFTKPHCCFNPSFLLTSSWLPWSHLLTDTSAWSCSRFSPSYSSLVDGLVFLPHWNVNYFQGPHGQIKESSSMVWLPVFLSSIISHLSHLFIFSLAKPGNYFLSMPHHVLHIWMPFLILPFPSIRVAFPPTSSWNTTLAVSQSNPSLFWSVQNHLQCQPSQHPHYQGCHPPSSP